MTVRQFMDLVPWGEMERISASQGPMIRHRTTGLCPICQVAMDLGRVRGPSDEPLETLNQRACKIGIMHLFLTWDESDMIVRTSDHSIGRLGYNSQMRADMEKRMINERKEKVTE